MHEEYGPVIRIRPGELAFADPQAWQDIYGQKVPGKMAGLQNGLKELPKYTPFYKFFNKEPENINTSSYQKHAVFRKMLATSFSDRNMREQEPIIKSYVDLLVMRLRENSQKLGALDLMLWYNWTTFDVIGDLSFGESFHCLEESRSHPFVNFAKALNHESARLLSLRYLGLHYLAVALFLPLARSGYKVKKYTSETLSKRLKVGKTRPDIIEPYITKYEEGAISLDTVRSTAAGLVFAGSETTATLLGGVTYLLLSNPAALERLVKEVRSAFQSEKDITMASVQGLPYMLACLNEALRHYPPAPTGFPRAVPKGGAVISGVYVPEHVSEYIVLYPYTSALLDSFLKLTLIFLQTAVSVHHWTSNHLKNNWVDPFEYRPERWLGDSKYAADKRESLKTFSHGPRDCVGKK
jgi:cytochrome P450